MEIEAIWDHIRFILHHISLLVTTCLGGGRTDTQTNIHIVDKLISRNQAHACCRPAHDCFKTVTGYL